MIRTSYDVRFFARAARRLSCDQFRRNAVELLVHELSRRRLRRELVRRREQEALEVRRPALGQELRRHPGRARRQRSVPSRRETGLDVPPGLRDLVDLADPGRHLLAREPLREDDRAASSAAAPPASVAVWPRSPPPRIAQADPTRIASTPRTKASATSRRRKIRPCEAFARCRRGGRGGGVMVVGSSTIPGSS